ncbi:hypothetical protein Daus18300_007394 [Diaporthe australafricana]|uniref:Uncharacterized protein n=1 Tax=Diaporthe australafricana TaxID=127596 RepID=A0ABR3WNN5_9PEZI
MAPVAVYILTRSKENADAAIARIKAHYQGREPRQCGSLEFILMDLMDFESIEVAAQSFLDRQGPEGRLDVLFNNAGTGGRKNAPTGRQGHEYHMTTNTLGAFLLTRLLTPILSKTAARMQHVPSAAGSVRVVWPASLLVDTGSPKSGVRKDYLENPDSAKDIDYIELYAMSRTGTWFLASEFARREGARSGVLHVAGNPGTYNTGMWQYTPTLLFWLVWPLLRDPVPHGADTYLWMGLSEDVTMDDAAAGRYAMCDGRWHPAQREDLIMSLRGVDEGGSGRAGEFYEWCEAKVRKFL